MAKTADVRVVTRSGSAAAVLSIEDESDYGTLVLAVKGVKWAPDDLPAGAYLKVNDPELRDMAAVAGFFVEPPTDWKRRMSRYAAVFIGVVGILCFFGSLFWAVRDLLAFDLIGAVAWVGLGIFMGFIGIGYLGSGEQNLLGDIASRHLTNRRIREDLTRAFRRGQRKGASPKDASEERDHPPES